MDFVKQPDSQVAAELHAPRRGVSTSSTATALASEELELIRRHAASTKEASPTKKAGTEPGWEEFLAALSAKYVALSDLDFGLQRLLRSSPQAWSDFLALNLSTPDSLHYDSGHGKPHELILYYIADKFIDFINTSNLYQDIFLGMDP